ncbi:MAG: YceI family protein, partial [Polyangiales bacterium]
MTRSRNILGILALTACTLASSAQADSEANRFALSAGKVRFVCEGPEVTVPAWGQFGTVEGAISIDPEDLTKAAGNIDVYLVSIRTDDSAWDTMFRRAGFLEIDDLPKSRFVLEKIQGATKLEERKWVPMKLEGQLTLHGISKKVSV